MTNKEQAPLHNATKSWPLWKQCEVRDFSREVPGTFIQAWMYKEKALELQDHVTHIGTQVLKLSFPYHLSTFPMDL